MTDTMLNEAWELRNTGLPMVAIAAKIGVPTSTLYRNLRSYQPDGSPPLPSKGALIDDIRSTLHRPLEEVSRADRMRTIFLLRGKGLSDTLLCEAMKVNLASFRTYLRHIDDQGLTQRMREDLKIIAAIKISKVTLGPASFSSSDIVRLLRRDYGISTSIKRVSRLLSSTTIAAPTLLSEAPAINCVRAIDQRVLRK